MCIKPQRGRFRHHPPRAWPQLLPARLQRASPTSISDGANDGFHEAIGDFVALSITPEYLVQIGLLDRSKVPQRRQGHRAAAAPGDGQGRLHAVRLLVDSWRWGVFDGSITPGELQQGVGRPEAPSIRASCRRSARSRSGLRSRRQVSHPGNTPYARYFLARVLQFQFYKAACDMAGWKGPLHRCSFYGNKEVGQRLKRC